MKFVKTSPALIAYAISAFLPFVVSAVDVEWTGAGANDKWKTSQNWSTDWCLPSSSDAVVFKGPWGEGKGRIADTESTQQTQSAIKFLNPLDEPMTIRGTGSAGGVKTGDTFYFGCGVGATGSAVFDGGTYSIPYYNKFKFASPGGGRADFVVTNDAVVKSGAFLLGEKATNNVVNITIAGGETSVYGITMQGVRGTNSVAVTGGRLLSVPWSGDSHSRIEIGTGSDGRSEFVVAGGCVIATNRNSTFNRGILAGGASNTLGRVEIRSGEVVTDGIVLGTSPFARAEYYQCGGLVRNVGNLVLGNYTAAAYKKIDAQVVFDGGVCSNKNIYIGHQRDKQTVGEMIVSNGLVVAEGKVLVANAGTGALIMEGGELIAVGGVVQHNNTGADSTSSRIRLNGGVLTTPYVVHVKHSGNPRASSLEFNGGTLRAASDTDILIGPTNELTVTVLENGGKIDTNGHRAVIPKEMSGAGALTKIGAGSLELTGANTYAGGTVVEEGLLVANATYAADVVLKGGGLLVPNRGKNPKVASLLVEGAGTLTTEIADGSCDCLRIDGAMTFEADAKLAIALSLPQDNQVRGTYALVSGLAGKATLDDFAVVPTKGYNVTLSLEAGVLYAKVRPASGLTLIIR